MTDATASVPQHLGIILDGNRRWAKAHGKPTLEGHRIGSENFKEIALGAFDRGVRYLSAYIFSSENWSRTAEEVGYLMKLVLRAFETYLDEFNRHGIKIIILGSRKELKQDIVAAIETTERKTADNTKGTLALCFNYGGQDEIAHAVQEMIRQGVDPDAVTPEQIGRNLYAPEIPDLDLVIRTSGEHRTSGFMLWRAAYSELYFVDKNWPDFSLDDLDAALADYSSRQRRFGS